MGVKIIFAGVAVLSLLALVFLATQKAPDAQVLFFAYGTNLDMETMKARAGGYTDAMAARARGYRIVFESNRETEFGVANIVLDNAGNVAGAVYWLREEQMAALDKSAGVPNFYSKKILAVALAGGKEVNATTYVLAGKTFAAPPSKPTMMAASAGLMQFGYGKEDAVVLAEAAALAKTD